VFESEEEGVPKVKIAEIFNKPSFAKINSVKSTEQGNPQQDLKDKEVIDSGCSRHKTRNRSYLTDYEEIDGGFIAFGGNSKEGKITGKVKIRTGKLDFEDVYFVKELKFNLFSVSQMCDKKNSVLFNDIECVVLSPNFKLTDESHVLLKVPRKDNMCSVDLKNVVPQGGLTCLFAKATPDESNLWHRRLGHVNFKTMNKLGIKREFSVARTPQQNKVAVPGKDYILLPMWHVDPLFSQNSKSSHDARFKPSGEDEKKVTKEPGKEGGDSSNDQEKDYNVNNINNINTASDENSTNNVNIVSLTVNAASIEDNAVDENIVYGYAFMPVRPIPTTRIHMDHLVEQIIRDIHSAPQTRRMIKSLTEHAMFSLVQQRTNHKDFQNCLFACFLSQEEPKKVFRNKKDERGIVIKNKERLVVQGYTQEEGIDCDEVFAPVARIEAIMLFLAYASYKDFVVYQMDVKSAFLYGKIEEEVYVCHPLGFEDPDFPIRVYKIEKELYGLHQVPRAWYETLSTYLLDNRFQRGKIDKNFFIRRDKGDILLVQVYVDDIIFGSTKSHYALNLRR
ncbi:putative ribonuclease H-like domain-containing protein, partial [Tanacetum coccineum]